MEPQHGESQIEVHPTIQTSAGRLRRYLRYVAKDVLLAFITMAALLGSDLFTHQADLPAWLRSLKSGSIEKLLPYIATSILAMASMLISVQFLVRFARARRMAQEAKGTEQIKVSIKEAYRTAINESIINPERRMI